MGFWTQNTDPKRKFNFDINITGADGAIKNYFAKTVTKPGFTVNSAEHNYLNHTFHYPGRLIWNDISITFVDPGKGTDSANDSASSGLVQMLSDAGYNPPSSATDRKTMSKSKAVKALGRVTITQRDDNNVALDQWVLTNAWISEVNFGDLDYSSDDLVEVTCTIKYDFAQYTDKSNTMVNVFEP